MPRTRRAEGGERGFGLGLGRVGAGVTSLGESESSWRANLDLRIRRCSGSAAGCTLRCPCDWACQPPIELYSIVAISSTAHPPRIFTGIVEPGSCPGFFTGTALATSTGILVRERSGFEVPRSRAWFGSWPDSRLSLRASPHSPASLEQRLATHGSTKRRVLVPLVAPSANLRGRPIARTIARVAKEPCTSARPAATSCSSRCAASRRARTPAARHADAAPSCRRMRSTCASFAGRAHMCSNSRAK